MQEVICKSPKPLIYYIREEENGIFLKKAGEHSVELLECYVLDDAADGKTESYYITSREGFQVKSETGMVLITGEVSPVTIEKFSGVPHRNIMGESISMEFMHGEKFEEAVYQFYWKTLIPSVIERTAADAYPVQDGYVVSTLQAEVYAGTYPDVDHEFQIKGRLAMLDCFDLGVVRRMLELQLKLMREDPEGAWRNPCALQPNGIREYHVRRSSMDGSANAEMFLLTGNIEIIESTWYYLSATKDWNWFRAHKEELEGVLSLVEACIDKKGRLWSDVYYEDQVIKDGRECIAAAFAANAMKCMADLESRVGDEEKRLKYLQLSEKLAEALIQESPDGFWDNENKRFTDWVDRNSVVHDHIHLLANQLPVLFGYATEEQEACVARLLEENFDEFQRFPSFVSARIQDYTEDEIGDGGPYDLCAAGRYWCWDFAYWKKKKRAEVLEQQFLSVCEQAKLDHYLMSERYDMNHVYYIDEKNWHGAERYYEYPCVFIWNLLHEYLGIKTDMDADMRIEPMLMKDGTVRLNSAAYGIQYRIKGDTLTVKNLADKEKSFVICWKQKEGRVVLKPEEEYSL